MQKPVRKQVQLTITLFLFWLLLTMDLSVMNLGLGFFIALGLSHFSQKYIYYGKDDFLEFPHIWDILHFLMHMLIEIYIASFVHIRRILKKDHNPTLITLKLDVKDPLIVTLIANAITLTPGTITIDAENNTLTILTIKDQPEEIEKIEVIVKEKLEAIFIKQVSR